MKKLWITLFLLFAFVSISHSAQQTLEEVTNPAYHGDAGTIQGGDIEDTMLNNATKSNANFAELYGKVIDTLTIVGDILTVTMTDATQKTVDLSSYVNTDDQLIMDFSLSGNVITLELEDGGTETVDLAPVLSGAPQQLADCTGITGGFCVDTDDQKLYLYNGSAVVEVPTGTPVDYTVVTTVGDPGSDTSVVTEQGIRELFDTAGGGDITGITAGVGLSGGGTSGDVTVNLASTAADVAIINAAGFDENLTTDIDTVQKLAQAVDDLELGSGSGYVAAPTYSDDSCTTGQRSFDSSYIYICEGTDTWDRYAVTFENWDNPTPITYSLTLDLEGVAGVDSVNIDGTDYTTDQIIAGLSGSTPITVTYGDHNTITWTGTDGGDVTGTSPDYSITMDADKSIIGTFTTEYTTIYESNCEDAGSITTGIVGTATLNGGTFETGETGNGIRLDSTADNIVIPFVDNGSGCIEFDYKATSDTVSRSDFFQATNNFTVRFDGDHNGALYWNNYAGETTPTTTHDASDETFRHYKFCWNAASELTIDIEGSQHSTSGAISVTAPTTTNLIIGYGQSAAYSANGVFDNIRVAQ